MKYSIIIPTYNNSEYTIKCVNSIKKNTNDFEIIWVDDASESTEYENVKKYLEQNNILFQTIRKKENGGFVSSVNSGIECALKSTSKYIIIQNNDTIVYDDWIDNMTTVMECDENIGIVGPLTTGFDVQSIDRLMVFYKEFPKDIQSKFAKEKRCDFINFISTKYKEGYLKTFERVAFFSVMIRREVFEDIGKLAIEYGYGYWDDDDFCERSLRSGWDIAISLGSFVSHEVGKSFEDKMGKVKWATKKFEISEKNKEIFQKKFGYGKYEKDLRSIEDEKILRIVAARKDIVQKNN